jgi:hypothetical protein
VNSNKYKIFLNVSALRGVINWFIKFVYQHLIAHEDGRAYQEVWKAKIPLKIQIFTGMVIQRAILTKDNMILRN